MWLTLPYYRYISYYSEQIAVNDALWDALFRLGWKDDERMATMMEKAGMDFEI